jgi:hypothetical protein
MRKGTWPGDWKTVCDVCGFWFPSSDIKDRWDNLKVCEKDWEIKHPQLTIRVPREHIAPPWTRPDPEDNEPYVCYLYARSAYAGLAEAGCVQANNDQFSYQFLLELKGNVNGN